MGLWDTLKQHAGAQFLDLIEWMDDTNDTLVWRFPVFNQAITDNSKVVVREGQAAVFVSEGKLSEVFGPGSYDIGTKNTPIMAFFETIKYQLQYPYKGDIYFVSTRQFTDNGWGTATPIMMRDAEFGPVRIRAYGVYSYRITKPDVFLREIVGTDGLFTTDEINKQLKKKLVSGVADTVGKAKIPVLDLAANYMDLGDTLRDRINPTFEEQYGIALTDFTIQSISLPEAVEKALDERTKMGVLGDLGAYTQLKTAEAIETAAANPGIGGAGVGMGVGFGMGNQMGNQMSRGMQGGGQFNPHQGMQGNPAPVPPPPPGNETFHYNGAGGQAQGLTADQVAQKVAGAPGGAHHVWQAGWSGWKPAKDVPAIAAKIAVPPPPPGQSSYHYSSGGQQSEKTVAEIVAAVKADPDGKHHVWQNGWSGWKDVKEVPEIAGELGGGGPPPPPPM